MVALLFRFFLNNGSGAFNPKVDYTTGTNPIGVDSADLTGMEGLIWQ